MGIVSREAERMNATLNKSEVAFSYFDSADKLLFWNDAYRRLNFRIRDLIRTGVQFQELLAALVAAKQIDIRGDVDDWLKARLAARKYGHTALRSLTNGRTFLVQERKDEIGGTLGVWVDVTQLASIGSLVCDDQFPPRHSMPMSNVDVQNMLRDKLQTVLMTLEFIDVALVDRELAGPVSEAISAVECITVILDAERHAAA
ncbi:MAG: PAS-domain containing protein [Pseudomonadota bacterium]